jgi:hypothetical protein
MDRKGKIMLVVVAILVAGAVLAFSANNILAQKSSESVTDANLETASTCTAGGCSADSCTCQGSCGCHANGGTCGCGGKCSAGAGCGCSAG